MDFVDGIVNKIKEKREVSFEVISGLYFNESDYYKILAAVYAHLDIKNNKVKSFLDVLKERTSFDKMVVSDIVGKISLGGLPNLTGRSFTEYEYQKIINAIHKYHNTSTVEVHQYVNILKNRVKKEDNIIASPEDANIFFEAMLNPPKPNEKLVQAFGHYQSIHSHNTKPTIGLIPRFIHDEKRVTEIRDAIKNYLDTPAMIPVEWITEYNEIVNKLTEPKDRITGKTLCQEEHQEGKRGMVKDY